MGLIQAIAGAAGGVMADQWKEFFYCESIPADVIVTKGSKKIDGKRSSNTKGHDNIISNGSVSRARSLICVHSPVSTFTILQQNRASSTENCLTRLLRHSNRSESVLRSAEIQARTREYTI